jgi:hypothetical protein
MNRDNPSNFRDRDEERFRPGQGAESWRQRGGRTGGSYGDGYRFQGADVGTYGNPGGGYGEYNWERGGDFVRPGRQEYNRWGDEIGRGREARWGRDDDRGEYGGGDYGRSSWGGERESGWGRGEQGYAQGAYGYGRGQGSMGSEGYPGSAYGGYGSGTRGEEGGGGWSSTRYGQGPSGYGPQGYSAERYGSYGQGGSTDWNRGRGTSDWRVGHYGKGPKGYTRSDDRLREDVSDRLTEDPEIDASGLTVTVKEAEITLDGTVPERHMKRRAEDIAEGVMGVRQVHNRLRVEDERRQAAEAGSLGVGTSVTTTGSSTNAGTRR